MTRIVSGLALAFTLIASVAFRRGACLYRRLRGRRVRGARLSGPDRRVGTVGGDRGQAVTAGFRLPAGYIFGGNRPRRSIR